MKIFFFFVFFTTFLFADNFETITQATTEGDPSVLIEGCVSALTGNIFINTIDIEAPGKESTYFGKNYFNMLDKRDYVPNPYLNHRDKYAGWEHFSHIYAYISYDRPHKKKNRRLDISEPSGVRQSYSFRKYKKLKKKDPEKFERWKNGTTELEFHKDGEAKQAFVNTSRGQISAKTNYRKNIVEKAGDRWLRVRCVDGTIRNYRRFQGGDENYCLDNEILPNGNIIKYAIGYGCYYPSGMEAFSPIRRLYSGISINFSKTEKVKKGITYPSDTNLSITTHTNKTLDCRYKMEESDKEYPSLLLKYTNSHYGQTNYEHLAHFVFYLNAYRSPQNRAIFFKYHLGDKHSKNYKKVSEIQMLKNDGQAFTTHFFSYEDNVTTIKDGLGNDTKYHFNSDHFRIDRIERYQHINGSQHLKNIEKFVWGCDAKTGFLCGKIIYNEHHQLIKGERYDYDGECRGNIIRKTFFGNITNTNSIAIQLAGDGLPAHNGADATTEDYTYTKNGSIQSETKQNGLKTEYTYHICQIDGEAFHTNLISTKFIRYEGIIKQRFFCEYDEHNVLIKEIQDDGSSENKNDLFSVSRRLIKRNIPRDTEPFGLTNIYEESYLDLETNEEKLIKMEIYDYSIDCNITRKDVYGSDRELKYTLTFQYDDRDNLTYQTDPLGREATYQYDQSNNKIYEKDFSKKETYFYYDNCNRLIKKIIKDKEKKYVEEYDYDANHNKIYEKDIYGNITCFEYDCTKNKTKELLPQVEDTFGAIKNPEISYLYDALGRQIEKKDALGNISQTSYNLFNKPILVQYPDGTKEEFLYNLDGPLNTYTNQLGTKTKYEYDYLQRVISKKLYSSSDQFLQDETFEYTAYDLISKKDPDGNITKYTYDGAGRKIKEEFFSNNNKLLSKEELFYDALGFVETTYQGEELISINKIDNIGRVKKEKKFNSSKELLFKIKYKYDEADNKIEIISYITAIEGNIRKNLQVNEHRDYDVFKRLIKTTDAYNNETHIIYEEDLQNNLIQKTIENPLHQKTISTYDGLNREKTVKHICPYGTTLSFEEKFYDLNNNLTRQVSHIYNGFGAELKNVATHWKYDSMNRSIAITEAYNTNDEKTTEYVYKHTLLDKTIKPDKTVLKYKYDSLSNQIELKSNQSSNEEDLYLSNKKIHYKFFYNKLNQLILVEDILSNKTTKRKYDAKNRLLKEKQANGLIIKNEYDLLGNKIKCTLPDQSFVQYQYDPINLKKVLRTRQNGDKYEHEFTLYDLSGNLLSEKLIDTSGRVNYLIDKLQRVLIVDTPYHLQNVTYDEIGRIDTIKWQKFLNDENTYCYDDLNQITNETGLFCNSYEFDSHFNRLSKNEEYCEINDLNEILSTNLKIFEYDKNGNPILKKSKDEEVKFFYDDLDRLIKVEILNGYTLKFKYDSFNRRISKKVLKPSNHILNKEIGFKYFLYDDQNEIGAFNKKLMQKELRVLANTKKAEIGSAISFEINHLIYAPIYDVSGNVASLIYQKSVTEHYRYSVFGEEKIYNSSKSEISHSFKSAPWRFSSKRTDDETHLIYYGRRYYDPEIGRWLTPDPQGFTDGFNLYAFVNNDPLINVDLYGLLALAYHLPNPLYYKAEDEFLGRKPTQYFHLNKPEISPHQRIYFSNGIFNTLDETKGSAEYLSKMINNRNIHTIYNEHQGFSDIPRAGMSLYFDVQSKACKMIQNEWTKYLDQDKRNTIFHVCHSEGNVNTRNALWEMSASYRNRITVVGIAPAAYMARDLAKYVRHYEAKRDLVAKFDLMGKIRNSDHTTVLDTQGYEDKHTHSFQHPIYGRRIREEIEKFLIQSE